MPGKLAIQKELRPGPHDTLAFEHNPDEPALHAALALGQQRIAADEVTLRERDRKGNGGFPRCDRLVHVIAV